MRNQKQQTPESTPEKKDKKDKKKKPVPTAEDVHIAPGYQNLLPGAPAVGDPPVPNRAWTEMRLGRDIDELSEDEKADLYLGHDRLF